ncbi:MAG: hypothetical protein COU46_01890 [Candidatus Niyogibacteria bacterium CG10_big_fil_rev_8_21_14_0_10_42_19]|uniref:DNA-formamidopyrimidine glycosylase n=1 Tax=Candidatus Niyogibacteria bacterium CG10_big_fil_rev_8_21_14_0_10_42_19 TaxID=1974725 RepID=A0A2H0TFM0_9BACT|nr:MAG: hypothetical protein COU46_01890 [Candidatus Niyogibacteria bacterium CG10_big_fil_rev_8_21_14_0_10_42_19]
MKNIMPELPEVEITKQKLIEQKIKGAVVEDFWTDRPQNLKLFSDIKIQKDIRGRKIISIERRGKVLFLGLSGRDKKNLAFHFRMSGRLILAEDVKKFKDTSTRAIVFLKGGKKILFRDPRKFGVIWYGGPDELKQDPYLGFLGPDMLEVTFRVFLERLKKRKGKIKSLLLDQKIVSGIGNIIADEALWYSKLHPETEIKKMSKAQIRKLYSDIRRVIHNIIKAGGTTLRDWAHPDGKEGGYEKVRRIYGRGKKNCFRCKNPVSRAVIAGRGTTFCPKCQKIDKVSTPAGGR